MKITSFQHFFALICNRRDNMAISTNRRVFKSEREDSRVLSVVHKLRRNVSDYHLFACFASRSQFYISKKVATVMFFAVIG